MDDSYVVHVHIIGHAQVRNRRTKDYVVRRRRGPVCERARPTGFSRVLGQVYIIDVSQGGITWQLFRRFASFVALNDVVRVARRGGVDGVARARLGTDSGNRLP